MIINFLLAQAAPAWVPIVALTVLIGLPLLCFVAAYLLRNKDFNLSDCLEPVRCWLKASWQRSDFLSVWMLAVNVLGIVFVVLMGIIVVTAYRHVRPENWHDLVTGFEFTLFFSLLIYLSAQGFRAWQWLLPNPRGPLVWPRRQHLEFRRGRVSCLVLVGLVTIEIAGLLVIARSGPMAGTSAFIRVRAGQGAAPELVSSSHSLIARELAERGYSIATDQSAATVLADVLVLPGKDEPILRLVDPGHDVVVAVVYSNHSAGRRSTWWNRDVFVARPGKDGVLRSGIAANFRVKTNDVGLRIVPDFGSSGGLDSRNTAQIFGAFRPDLGTPRTKVFLEIEPNRSAIDEINYADFDAKMEAALYRCVYFANMDVAASQESASMVVTASDWRKEVASNGEVGVSASISCRNAKTGEPLWSLTVGGRTGSGLIRSGDESPKAVEHWIGNLEESVPQRLIGERK